MHDIFNCLSVGLVVAAGLPSFPTEGDLAPRPPSSAKCIFSDGSSMVNVTSEDETDTESRPKRRVARRSVLALSSLGVSGCLRYVRPTDGADETAPTESEESTEADAETDTESEPTFDPLDLPPGVHEDGVRVGLLNHTTENLPKLVSNPRSSPTDPLGIFLSKRLSHSALTKTHSSVSTAVVTRWFRCMLKRRCRASARRARRNDSLH